LAEDVDDQIPPREEVVVGRVFTQGEAEGEEDGAEGLEPGEFVAFVAAVCLFKFKGYQERFILIKFSALLKLEERAAGESVCM